jgi:hypothetical protein
MPAASVHREPEGAWRGFDAFDVIDSGSASFALEDLLDDRRGECGGALDDLTRMLDSAHDRFEAGDSVGGIAGLRGFEREVERLRDAEQLSRGFASDLVTLAEVAIEWAGQAQPDGDETWPEMWTDASPDDLTV